MTYLIVGLDRRTHTPWHENLGAHDAQTAVQIAVERAATAGIDLEVAAVIGPNCRVVEDPAAERAARFSVA